MSRAGLVEEGIFIIDHVIQNNKGKIKDDEYEVLLLRKGMFNFQLGEMDLAINNFQEIINQDPTNEGALTNLARTYIRIGRTDEAVSLLQQSTQHHPESFWSFHLLGRAHFIKGNFDHSVSAYQRALEINTSHEETAMYLGQAFCRAGRVDEALLTLRGVSSRSTTDALTNQADDWISTIENHGTCP
jgi:Flp pilus assembly protein TadD